MTHSDYMKRAVELALKARGKTSPNPMVGSVIVKRNRIIAEGWHARCGADHAEIVALKKAGKNSRDAKMYINLEPCNHMGRTPPCVDQIIQQGIKEVYIGMKDPNPLTNGKSITKLRRKGIKTKVGILRNESEALNETFIKFTRQKIPYVAAKCAQTLDGKIATANGKSKWITSTSARQYARSIRDEYDAIMVGINTVLNDNPRLNGSRKTKRIKKIVLDSRLRTPMNARLFAGSRPSDCYIAVDRRVPKGKISRFVKKGVNIIPCPGHRGQIDLKWLLRDLARKEIMSLLIEGGAHIIGSALKQKLVDKMYIYIAPKIIGDQSALDSVVSVHTTNIGKSIQLKNLTLKEIGKDILLQGYIIN